MDRKKLVKITQGIFLRKIRDKLRNKRKDTNIPNPNPNEKGN